MNAAQTKSVPDLRFPEFSEDWKQQRVGRLLEEYREKSTTTDQHEVLTSSRSGLVRQKDYYENSRLTERDNLGFNVIPPNHVTYRSRSDDRRFFFNENLLGVTGIISTYYPVFRIKGGANKFFIELFRKNEHHIGKYSVGTSQTVLSFIELKRIKLSIPTEAEQQKIADFLSAVDQKIQQLSEKHRLLTEYKKGVMQKIFSQQIRFTDDNGQPYPDWEEKKLGDVASFTKGKGISKGDISENGTLECIRYGELYTDYNETIASVKSRTNSSPSDLVLSKANDVIIPASGETQLDISTASCVLKPGVALGGDLNIIRSKLNGVFLSYYLNAWRKHQIARFAQGISVVHLYSSQLKALLVDVPCDEEQKKIATFLQTIDSKIDHVNQQLEQAQAFKKGLLQQMFV